VVVASASAPSAPLASAGSPSERNAPIPGFADRARIVVRPVGRDGLELAVARSLSDQERADTSFERALLIGAPLVLLLVLAGSYEVARRALAPVEEAAARERAFIADASHELRTPLARLQAHLELTQASADGEDALRDALRQANAEVQGLGALAADLLTLAALSEYGRPLPAAPTDLAELLAEVVASRQDAASGGGRTFDLQAEPLVVVGDAGRLRQAIGNLLDNALVHGQGTVRVRAGEAAGAVRVSVSDEGSGLDLALDEAVGRFTRGTRGRTRPGAGLGLALVHAVAAAHGGRVESGPAGTTEVILVLPRARASAGS
jgi:two-component system OmpR family sensor kinase